eukprot:a341885_115.p1 GENE.a341885_115~~a341885_115.p1  ORF type:complete len:155 (-),score=53.05 a341885_115:8-436(-)
MAMSCIARGAAARCSMGVAARALHSNAGPRGMGAGTIVFVEDLDDYEKEIAKPMVVANFTASWCGPCRKIAPVFESLAMQNAKDVTFLKIDVDRAADIASKEAISAVPSFLFFKGGKRLGGFSGADVAKLTGFIDKMKGGDK